MPVVNRGKKGGSVLERRLSYHGEKNEKTRCFRVCLRCIYLVGISLFVILLWLFHNSLHVDTQHQVVPVAQQQQQQHTSRPLGVTRPRRRTRAHICYKQVHNQIGTRLLVSEFNYTGVDATKGNDWDLIYGGYPHCGKNATPVLGTKIPEVNVKRKWDWKMETGLNRMLNEQGWDKLKPHQVYYPCMGCSTSYCNKRDLCRILSGINPEWCYVLPDHMDRLKAKLDGTRLWVLKKDASDKHIHTGKGVSYIRLPHELPSTEELNKGMYLVQRWNEPFLGKGPLRRKSEMRVQVALTSVYPLRAYVWSEPYVILAAKNYTNATAALKNRCMMDTHSSTANCNKHVEDTEFGKMLLESPLCNRCLPFKVYADKVGMTSSQGDKLLDETFKLIAQVLKAGHALLEKHPINEGIQTSGASCFSQMRVDLGITSDGKPFIFEFPEFHNMKGKLGTVKVASTRDLFKMIGLDATPLPMEQRAEYESKHLGGWIHIV